VAAADTVLFDFETGSQGWASFGPLTTDSGVTPDGFLGQARFHVADFDLTGWGIVDVSPVVDLAEYEGLRVAARLADVPGYTPFVGTPEMTVQLAIGDATWSSNVVLTPDYQLYTTRFDELVPDGEFATAPITVEQLSDPALQIKLVVLKGTNSGIAELDYDQVTGIGGEGPAQFLPGEVIYDFNTNGGFNPCYPDDWTFFGYPQTDFGIDFGAEDGSGAFQAADWTGCEISGLPQCEWVGSGVGLGPFAHPHCMEGGVSDANLDLSLGTGLSIRLQVDLTVGFGGTEGARVQLQLTDDDGTNAVLSRNVIDHPTVDRTVPVLDEWRTITIPFAGLDSAFDNDDAVAGAIEGLNLSHITAIKLIWRRYASDGVNVFEFDDITLTDDPVSPWADRDGDGAVDLADFTLMQACFGGDPLTPECAPLDADRDGDVDVSDYPVFDDCMQGPAVTGDYYPWCY
jgi:hypothetical protein